MEMLSVINENRLLKKIQFFFENPSEVLKELAQNACRSGATTLQISFDNNELTIIDNGKGLDNPYHFIVLAESNWSDVIDKNQNPAGFGSYILLSISENVTLISSFGKLTINCEQFFNNQEYRKSIIYSIDKEKRYQGGLKIVAKIKEEAKEYLLSKIDDLGYFPLMITVNGKAVRNIRLDKMFMHNFETEFQGNKVYINTDKFCNYIYDGKIVERLKRDLFVRYYGAPIGDINYYHTSVVIDVEKGDILTPVLPYRRSIKHDEKFDMFSEFIRKTIVEYCFSELSKLSKSSVIDTYYIVRILNCLISNATDDEFNSLDVFYVIYEEPFYHDGIESTYTEYKILNKKDMPLTINKFNKLTIIENGITDELFFKDLEYSLHLPQSSFGTITLPSRLPKWFSYKEIINDIKVVCKSKTYSGNYDWVEVKEISKEISFNDGTPIKALAIFNSCCEGRIFYSEKPENFVVLLDSVFNGNVYNNEGDSVETQLDYFQKEVYKDIAEMKKEYPLFQLFEGFNYVSGLKVDEINRITFQKKSKKLLIENDDGSALTLSYFI